VAKYYADSQVRGVVLAARGQATTFTAIISQTGSPAPHHHTRPVASCPGRCLLTLDRPIPFDDLVAEDQELLRSQSLDVATELQAAITQACVNHITFNNKVNP
jgi:hypothetical protein